jgi:diacylglycerol kinase (ATP)
MFIIAVPVALSLPLGTPPKAALISAMFLVLMAEIANTAIKAIAGQSDDLMLKKAKNAGSVLVFVAILNAVTTWALIIYPIIIKI